MQVSWVPARAAAQAVAGSGLWLRHGPGDPPRFLFFLLQARVGDQPPPPPQGKASRGRSEAAATGCSGIVAAVGGGRGKRGRERKDTKTEGKMRPEQCSEGTQQSIPWYECASG
ncbi:hypothetical protein MC885_013226 [Smutsia gigantea]|nr:hypothetical protein MC885_013226 [Smutsia gigantea]